uniref:Putative salivary secreted peptide n=1 Tax=Glossina morsitans morsitans TaxID=37546 RepID=D3TQ49_GLOMM
MKFLTIVFAIILALACLVILSSAQRRPNVLEVLPPLPSQLRSCGLAFRDILRSLLSTLQTNPLFRGVADFLRAIFPGLNFSPQFSLSTSFSAK